MNHRSAIKIIVACGAISFLSNVWAESFGFDRPGQALGTAIVPKGHLAWEQALPSVSFDEYHENGIKQREVVVQADALLRLGVGNGAELRLGWNGPTWAQYKATNQPKNEVDGVGDVQLGVKKSIDLKDENLSWALLAQVNLATGDEEFTSDKEIYTVASALSYKFSEDITTAITLSYDYYDGQLAVTAIPSIEYPIQGKLSGFSEYVFKKSESQHYQSVVNTGLTWAVLDQLQFDASLGHSFNRQQPEWNAGLGVSYLF